MYALKRKASRSTSRAPSTKLTRRVFPGRSLVVVNPSIGVGTSATTVLRTSFFVNVSAVAGTGLFTGFMKPGSAFDPCGDLSSAQPTFFDQFAAIYNRYKVNEFTIRMKITGMTGANNAAWVCAMYPAVDSTPLAAYQSAASQPYAKTTSGGFQIFYAGATPYGVGTEGKYLTLKMKHAAVMGARVDDYDNGALVSADPTALQYAVAPMYLLGSGVGTHTWVLEIDMFQNVTFSQKKNVIDA